MAELAVITKQLDFHLEQVQDFTPTPMTVATEAWYTGFHPYTLEPVFSAKTQREKLAQRQFFFWYKPEERRNIVNELRRIGRADLIDKLYERGNDNFLFPHFTYSFSFTGNATISSSTLTAVSTFGISFTNIDRRPFCSLKSHLRVYFII